MRRKVCGLLAICALALAVVPVAAGGPPDNPNCFGKGASQLGQAGEMGDHASSPPPPDLTPGRPGRAGIGNVADALTGTHQPGELGELLGAECG